MFTKSLNAKMEVDSNKVKERRVKETILTDVFDAG